MRNECNIIKDILPLYAEDMVSSDTIDFVESHLKVCAACRAELQRMENPSAFVPTMMDDSSSGKSAIKAVQTRLRRYSIKKMLHGAIAVILLFTLMLSLYAYFHVEGNEIKGVPEISEVCTVTLIVYQHMSYENRTEYVLNREEIQILKNLLQGSSFTRVLTSVVFFEDRDRYDIQIDYNDGQNFLSISCVGNEYISVANQFGGKHLKVNNPQWEEALSKLANLNK